MLPLSSQPYLASTTHRLQEKHSDLAGLPDKACFQMNDTHPTIAVRQCWQRRGFAILLPPPALPWQHRRTCCCFLRSSLILANTRSPVSRWRS